MWHRITWWNPRLVRVGQWAARATSTTFQVRLSRHRIRLLVWRLLTACCVWQRFLHASRNTRQLISVLEQLIVWLLLFLSAETVSLVWYQHKLHCSARWHFDWKSNMICCARNFARVDFEYTTRCRQACSVMSAVTSTAVPVSPSRGQAPRVWPPPSTLTKPQWRHLASLCCMKAAALALCQSKSHCTARQRNLDLDTQPRFELTTNNTSLLHNLVDLRFFWRDEQHAMCLRFKICPLLMHSCLHMYVDVYSTNYKKSDVCAVVDDCRTQTWSSACRSCWAVSTTPTTCVISVPPRWTFT